MKPIELIRMLDKGVVEELKMYYNGRRSVIDIRNLPALMPNYDITKLWNSEDGKGISVILKDAEEVANNDDLREKMKKLYYQELRKEAEND